MGPQNHEEAFAELIRFFSRWRVPTAWRPCTIYAMRNSGKAAACGLRRAPSRRYGNNQGICDECIYGMVASDYLKGNNVGK